MQVRKKKGLNEWAATAICGNDITSSCLYVSALSIVYAGQWAWVSLLMVSVVLYFYRNIYAEVVGALPLNGGAYNALLNTTSKFVASLAACFTLLSYMATAVLSANEAMHFVTVIDAEESVPSRLAEDIRFLDRAYPEIDIEFVVQYGKFGPELIQRLSTLWGIPANFMFIGSPNGEFSYDLAELGGVRLII